MSASIWYLTTETDSVNPHAGLEAATVIQLHRIRCSQYDHGIFETNMFFVFFLGEMNHVLLCNTFYFQTLYLNI